MVIVQNAVFLKVSYSNDTDCLKLGVVALAPNTYNTNSSRSYFVQIFEQSGSCWLYVAAVERYVRNVHGLREHGFGLELVDECHDARGGPGYRATVGRVVAGDVDVVRQSAFDRGVAETDRGHHAVRQFRFHGRSTPGVRRHYHFFGGEAAVGVRAAQLADRMPDHAVRLDVQRSQNVHQTDLRHKRISYGNE